MMEGEHLPAESKRMSEKYPLTVSRTAKELALPVSACCKSPVSATQQKPCVDHVTSKEPSSSSAPVGRARFYFESDALALKNNPE